MKILAIGAHHDDVELGCGGSLLLWREQGHAVTIFTATRSGYRDPFGAAVRPDDVAREEGRAAAAFLGASLIAGDTETLALEFAEPLNRELLQVVQRLQPDLVLTHWSGDVHHDHRALALASQHCCRHVPRLLTYCANWYEGDRRFDPRFFVDVSTTLERKVELLRIYRSENERTGQVWADFVRSSARLNGLKTGVRFAEAFEVVGWRW